MLHDDAMVGRLLTRRELVALFGSSAAAAIMARSVAGQTPSPAACVVQPQQTEGPYFVDEKLLRSDVRSDPSTGVRKAGAPLALTLMVSQVPSGGTCAPVQGAQVDIWQCDALGVYTDVKDPSFDTTNQKFLRGHQITDASGAAKFVTIYPGWYPGRAVHIHFKVRTAGAAASSAYEFTSQFYFDEGLNDRVFRRAPYSSHSGKRTRNEEDQIYRTQGGSQLILAVHEQQNGYSTTFNLAMRPGDPAPAGRGQNRGNR